MLINIVNSLAPPLTNNLSAILRYCDGSNNCSQDELSILDNAVIRDVAGAN